MSEITITTTQPSASTLQASKLEKARNCLQIQMLDNNDATRFLSDRYRNCLTAGESVAISAKVEVEDNIVQASQFVQVDVDSLPLSSLQGRDDELFLSALRLFPGFLLESAKLYIKNCQAAPAPDLMQAVRELDYARQQMIACNLGLVGAIANQYRATSIGYDDLLQEGVLGLIKAVDRFDVERGFQFSTYASYWIKQAISRLITKQDRIVHLPIAVAEKSGKVLEAMRNFFLVNQRWPSQQQLLTSLQDCDGMSEDEIKAIHRYHQAQYSLDASYQSEEGDGLELMTRMRQQQFALPLDELIERDFSRYLTDAVDSLPPKEADIINMRFGLKNHTEMTLQAVADQLQVTRERVRQIQNRALDKLRQRFGFDLMPFLETNDGYQ